MSECLWPIQILVFRFTLEYWDKWACHSNCFLLLISAFTFLQWMKCKQKSGNSSVVRAPDLWLKGRRFKSCRCGRRIFFLIQGWLSVLLFRYPFHPSVTALARKRSRSFWQKCRWQVTAKHAYVALHEVTWLYGVHRTCAETAAVSCGTSHASSVSTPLRWIFKKRAIKSLSLM